MAQPQESAPQGRNETQQQHKDGDISPIQTFSSRIETRRDITDLDFGGYHYDGYVRPASPNPPSSPTLGGRESLVSLPTQQAGSTPHLNRSGSRRWSTPFENHVYQAVGGGGSTNPSATIVARPASIQSTKGGRFSGVNHTTFETIPEGKESIEIAILPAAALIDGYGPNDHPPQMKTSPEVLEWQEQEKAGQLSGGLGVGFKPGTTMRERDLLSSDDQEHNRSPLRSLSLTRRNTSLNRSATRKTLGQNEADMTGKAVRVIIEDAESDERKDVITLRESKVDLSVIAGEAMDSEEPNESSFLRTRSTTFSSKVQRTETFYPQPNWKPFSMRWPYLSTLIALSIMLAALTEVLYQSSARTPLVTFHTPQQIKPAVYCKQSGVKPRFPFPFLS